MRSFHPSSASVLLGLGLILATLFVATPALAENGGPQCYSRAHDGFLNGYALELPPSSGWKTIGRLEYQLASPSDVVLSVRLAYAEDTYPNGNVRYRFLVDGASAGPIFKVRTPEHAQDGDLLKAFKANRSGTIEIEIQAENLETVSGRDVYYNEVWLSPLLVDSSQTTVNTSNNPAQAVSSSSTWKTLVTLPSISQGGKRVYLGAFVKPTSGWNQAYDLAIFRGSTELHRFRLKTPDSDPSGESVAFFTPVASGSQTYSLRARLASGSSTVSLANNWLFGVTVPGGWTLFEKDGLASNVSVSGNGRTPTELTTVAFTQVSKISSDSLGTCPNGPSAKCWSLGHGFAYFTTTAGSHENETSFKSYVYDRSDEPTTPAELADIYSTFDVAYGPSHTQGEVNLHSLPGGGGAYIGWDADQDYLLRFGGYKYDGHSSCSANSSAPHPVIDKSFFLFQYLMVPSTPHWDQVTTGTEYCAAKDIKPTAPCVVHFKPGNAWYSARLDPNMHYACETDLESVQVSSKNCN